MFPERILIEEAETNDIEAIAELEKRSFDDPWSSESIENEFYNNPLAYFFVARNEGIIIGYIGVWLVFEEIHITTLAVEDKYRRQGIGTDLVNTVISHFTKHGACSATLEVRPSNRAARILYEKMGFTLCGKRNAYYKDEDALLMSRNLNGSGQVGNKENKGGG